MKYFGSIPRGKPITRPKVAPVTLTAEKRLVYEDKVPLPRLYMQWPTVGTGHPDYVALEVLGPVLAGARTARLTKALVYDKQAAATIKGTVQIGPSTSTDSISGRVMTAEGQPIRNAVVTLRGNSLGTPLKATTDSFGYYWFSGLTAGETYVVTATSQRFTFTMPSRVITLADNFMDVDFTGDE